MSPEEFEARDRAERRALAAVAKLAFAAADALVTLRRTGRLEGLPNEFTVRAAEYEALMKSLVPESPANASGSPSVAPSTLARAG